MSDPTLEMAVSGDPRNVTIATLPSSGSPSLTYVGPFDNSQIRLQFRRELLREARSSSFHNQVGIDPDPCRAQDQQIGT